MKSFLSYLGGKSQLAGKIIPKIPKHSCYVETFAGAAWLFFRKEPSEVEIINDINAELVTLYRVIKLHLDEFIRYIRWILVARDEFDRFRAERPECLTDIQRAVRFYYLLRCGYAAKVHKPSFTSSPTRAPRLNLLRIEEDLSEAHLRLSRVTIENQAYDRILERFDRPSTFFYIDPPYYGHEGDYGLGIFKRDDFAIMEQLLAGMKGKFIMSINDCLEIRKLYKRFSIEEVSTSYTASGANKRKTITELLIRNF
jgi:DNA adenine methylase